MGIAVEAKLDVYCYVPPHDDAQKWSANIVYKSMQFRCCTELRRKTMIYMVIRGGHFKALATPSILPTTKQAFTVMDLLQSESDPATSKCVNSLYVIVQCVKSRCHLISVLTVQTNSYGSTATGGHSHSIASHDKQNKRCRKVLQSNPVCEKR
jgi:hypothetical protein